MTTNEYFVYYLLTTYEILKMSAGDPTTEDIKGLILKKAIDRFVQYGFGKTTMVEIARDCGMSAGNL